MRWNLSATRHAANRADAIFISFPKSGRTWFRMFWSAYWCHRAGRDFQLDPAGIDGMPSVFFTHDRWEHLTEVSFSKRILGQYLLPAAAAAKTPKLLLARDPRDVIVSLYFHLTKRGERKRLVKPASLKELVRDPEFGVAMVVRLLNDWNTEWGATTSFRIMRYEQARAEPESAMREWFAFCGIATPEPAAFAHALAFSDFDAVREREKGGGFRNKLLSARDVSDPESFKARRGVVGGFSDYLDADDIAVCNAAMARLHPVFGYRP
jgi:hypothetical protein